MRRSRGRRAGIGSTICERQQVKRERNREGGVRKRDKETQRSVEKVREKERRERIRTAVNREGVARNILASPRAPSCVLNHFPVDSAVCNPIIGVSPPGKLLFYSRTTRVPDVPVYRDILSLSHPAFFLLRTFSLARFHSFPARSRL